MARIKDLNSALPAENDAFAFDGANGTKRISYAEFKQKLIDDGFGSGSSEAVVLTQAEYDALPDDVKDSDTIFFISDAPFESSNVVTLTQAEYNALSDATKNDGRFYYVTDEAEVAKSLVVQTNQNSAETVPSSAVVYSGLKALDDSLSTLFVTRLFTASYTVAANSSINISGTTLGYSVPTGYKPVCLVDFYSGSGDVVLKNYFLTNSGADTVINLRNVTNSSITASTQIRVLFAKSTMFSN